jgi:iron complex outermembrane receptor protein
MQVAVVRASRLIFMSTASSLILLSTNLDLQAQTVLPPVNVEAPAATNRPVVRRQGQPRRVVSRNRARPNPAVQATPAPEAAVGAREVGSGPVQGLVATQTASGTKTNTPIVEVPQTINVVPRDQIIAQGAQTVGEALRYTPGVQVEPNGVGDFSSTFSRVRGFRSDLYLDGLRLPQNPAAAGYAEVEPYDLERIEVLKGPSSGLYGSSGPGGLINMTSKRPSEVPVHEVAVQTGSYNRKQVQFDFSDRFVGSGDNALFRIVGLFRDADHQIDYMTDKREFIAPSFTFKNEDTKLTLLTSYFHADNRFNFFNALPASGTILPNPNGRISQHLYNGEPSYDRLKREQYNVGYAFEHKFNEAIEFRQNVRYTHIDTDWNAIAPSRQGTNPALNNDPRTGLLPGDPTMRNTRRGAIYTGSESKSFNVDNQFEARFATGPVAHDLVVGVDYRTLDSTYVYTAGGTRTTLDVFNPTYGFTIAPPNTPFNDDIYRLSQTGVYAQDQIKFGGFILTVGGRQDWATSLIDSKLDTRGFYGPTDTAATGRVGLGYQFANGVVPYVSYATSFDPTVGVTRAGTPFRPTTGVQFEGGVKYQPLGAKTLITAAGFDITQQNVLTSDPQNPGFSIQTGEVNVKGFEFEARTEVLPKLNIIAGYTFLNAQVTRSNIVGEVGTRPGFTPPHQASLWAQHGLSGPHLNGLTVGAGIRYVGATNSPFQPATNYGGAVGVLPGFVLNVPAYTLVDAMASYDLKYLFPSLTGANLRLNVTNLFNQYYIAGCNSVIQCSMGYGRQALATLAYRW